MENIIEDLLARISQTITQNPSIAGLAMNGHTLRLAVAMRPGVASLTTNTTGTIFKTPVTNDESQANWAFTHN